MSARTVWLQEVNDVYEQCLRVPGEISSMVAAALEQTCQDHGCASLNQMQKLIRFRMHPASVLLLYLQRLDEEGIEISSPWSMRRSGGRTIAESLWPTLQEIFHRKLREGTIVLDEPESPWEKAQICVSAINSLGKAGILGIQQLKARDGRWLSREQLRDKKCEITKSEHRVLTEWLNKIPQSADCSGESHPGASGPRKCSRWSRENENGQCLASESALQLLEQCGGARELPPCIRGSAIKRTPHDGVLMEQSTINEIPETPIEDLQDSLLVDWLCRVRATFSLPLGNDRVAELECLIALERIWHEKLTANYIVAQEFNQRLSTVLPSSAPNCYYSRRLQRI